MDARAELKSNIITSIIVFTLIAGFVLYTVRKLAKIDEEKNRQLADTLGELKVKNKDITDSINYARRIQAALIPKNEEIAASLKNYFMFYEPRDVVSGDFPWYYKKDHYIYIAAVDCTGHGVPGAMMSIIGCLLLNDIINNDGYPTAAEMLNSLHKSVVETLKQNSEDGIADGMDAGICRIDTRDGEVCYSGAHRPLYHLVNGEIIQFKGDKYPVGGVQYKGENSFEDHILAPKKGESIYFFSDGLPDQFGGEGGKKYGPKRIRDLIIENDQFETFEDKFKTAYLNWKGSTKQTDDILMIGIKF